MMAINMTNILRFFDRRRNFCLGVFFTATILVLPGCSTTSEPTATDSNPVEQTATSNTVIEGKNVATGRFEGRSDHVVSGDVAIVESEGQYFVQLGDDFSLDDAPDPKVGLGQDGYDPKTKSGHLISFKGASSYEVPKNIDVKAYNEVYIWCEKFDVPLGVASIKFQ